MGEKVKVGTVFTYFSKIGVAGVRVTDGELRVGDTISIEGHTTNFTQKVESMEKDHGPIEVARVGDEIGLKVKEKARNHDVVYKIIE